MFHTVHEKEESRNFYCKKVDCVLEILFVLYEMYYLYCRKINSYYCKTGQCLYLVHFSRNTIVMKFRPFYLPSKNHQSY